jgi:hypothetical protein
MKEKNEMESKSLEEELSYLLSKTIYLEDELNNLLNEKN